METASTPNGSWPGLAPSRRARVAGVGARWGWLRAGLLVASVAGVNWLGCAISPKPEPPIQQSVTVNLGGVETIPANGFGPWLVMGGPGAASPAGAELHVVNLDNELEPVVGLVEDDGSFAVEILADEGDEVRLQLLTDTARSTPADFLVGGHAGSVLPAPRPLAECLILTPALELDTALEATLTVHNGCGSTVQLAAPTLRRPVAGLDVAPATGWPTTLTPGQSTTLTIGFVAPAGAFEEVVFVEASAPDADRRPITVWPTTP